MSADLFAGRYELLYEAPPGAAGRLFEVRDTQTGELVALKVFRRELPTDSAERGDLERFFGAAQACSHPHIVRYHHLALEDNYLIREWVHGFPLIDLLRRRRELPGAEVIALLNDVPETIDAAVAADLAPTGDLLSRLFVSWDRTLPADELVRLRGVPVTEWKGFAVKLNPMPLSSLLPLSPEETMHTMVSPMMASAGPMLTPSAAFAETIHQLLGAPRRSDRRRRYVPLGTLNEAGNNVLRRVVEGGTPPANCAIFWKELLDATGLSAQPRKISPPPPPPPPILRDPPPSPHSAPPPPPPPPPPSPKAPVLPPPLPKRRTLHIPEAFLGNVQPGSILRLTPRDISFTPIQLIARPLFRFGRSLYHSDFVTRVLPETPENEKLTKELGRVHAIGELSGDSITLRDGNGEQASVNGSTFEGKMLSTDKLTYVKGRGVLTLYRNYELEVVPMLGSTDLGWQIDNEADWTGPAPENSALRGAVVFLPRRNQPALRQAAWLFSRLDFALTPRGDITWCEAGSSLSQASFVYHRGTFWIATFNPPPGALSINNIELPHDSAIPLASGQPVQLGPGHYIAEIQ